MGVWSLPNDPPRLDPRATVARRRWTAKLLALAGGAWVHSSPLARFFVHSDRSIGVALMVYGFVASVLPVWLLLAPRDYLSTFMKIGAIALLAVGVIIVNPRLHMPALTSFARTGGPVFPGPLLPYVFITIACGAISGFHSLISSGTTPKMLDRERHMLPIGYGAMLVEGFVGVIALIAACSLQPPDYFAINSKPDVFAQLGMVVQNLGQLEASVGEKLAGRPGGAVSLAVGMAQIFSTIPFLRGLMAFWYHFAIMFEALFVLTIIDAGTRVMRYMLQDVGGLVAPRLRSWKGTSAAVFFSLLAVACWGYFVWTGTVSTIWRGVTNQVLAAFALASAPRCSSNLGRARTCGERSVPLAFICVTSPVGGLAEPRVTTWAPAAGPAPTDRRFAARRSRARAVHRGASARDGAARGRAGGSRRALTRAPPPRRAGDGARAGRRDRGLSRERGTAGPHGGGRSRPAGNRQASVRASE